MYYIGKKRNAKATYDAAANEQETHATWRNKIRNADNIRKKCNAETRRKKKRKAKYIPEFP